MRNVKYGLVAVALLVVVPLLGMGAGAPQVAPQGATDPEIQKLADDYTAAWAKGDAATIATLYTPDGLYVTAGKLMAGRSEIQTGFVELFGGPYKGSTITIHMGQMRQISPDVRIGEGTWELAGVTGAAPAATAPAGATAGTAKATVAGPAPTSGRFLNTLVRQQGKWLIAATATTPDQPMAR